MNAPLLLLLSLGTLPPLPSSDLEAIGRRVWQNEAAGKVEGLVDWNSGEAFASLGIGHFIWYPPGPKGPFEESFPGLVRFLTAKGAPPPDWLKPEMACPWPDRSAFLKDFQSPKVKALRQWLASTVPLQSQFLAERLEHALPKMLESLPKERREAVKRSFESLAATPQGRFALIDYVNFKGEGTKATERYAGQGWGLLQVLEGMPPGGHAADFSKSATETLRRRVRNAPPERNEERWLPGWLNRVQAYAQRP
jgi:hypothetical protein